MMGLYVDNCLQFVDIFNLISTLSVSVSGHFSCLLTAAPRKREEGRKGVEPGGGTAAEKRKRKKK